MANPIIDLDNISVTFKQRKQVVHAVKDVTLKVEKGDIYGIVGYSGAGKSTLVRTINLLQLKMSFLLLNILTWMMTQRRRRRLNF